MPFGNLTTKNSSVLLLFPGPTLTVTFVTQVQVIMSCAKYDGSSRGFFCSNYVSDEKLFFLDVQYADIGQYESTLILEGAAAFLGFLSTECKNAAGLLLCGVSFPDCKEGTDDKVTFPKPVCRIACQNFVAACMEDFFKPGGEADTVRMMGFTFPECDA
jgi:hypothetical protein